jgi:uncharacterized membrane protein
METEQAAPQADKPKRELAPLRVSDPLRWLRAGWLDLRAAPGISFFYGVCFWLMAVILGAIFGKIPQYTLSFISGCFLVGPFLAMGIYEVSRRRELGLPQSLGDSLTCWGGHLGAMGMLVLVMLLLELLCSEWTSGASKCARRKDKQAALKPRESFASCSTASWLRQLPMSKTG